MPDLGGLDGLESKLGLGLGVLGGLFLGVNTKAAGILTVLSDFWKSFGEEAKAAVMTFGSI